MTNSTISTAFEVTKRLLSEHQNIMVSISGGSDSDVILDLVMRAQQSTAEHRNIHFVFFDTGLEFEATLKHIAFLEQRYNICIEHIYPSKNVPCACDEHGAPFISKYASEMMMRLQKHDFKWEDKPFEELYTTYPNCKIGLQWWCNLNKSPSFNIAFNKYLKEFLISHPPTFKISSKCCHYSKVTPSTKYIREHNIDLHITGVRKAEGGVRAKQYKDILSTNEKTNLTEYRPIWWFTNEDKREYETQYGIVHSECYTKYKFSRTGCAGCPFGKNAEHEIETARLNEPSTYDKMLKTFKNSYDYTMEYRTFRKNKMV